MTDYWDFIEVNINNLAAVPSIVFGLLGLAVFLGFFGMPRSAPLVGGMVLALMTLPTIIIATRASIRAVPTSIRDAALGLGASRMQAAIDHILPLAAPGILTGTIIGAGVGFLLGLPLAGVGGVVTVPIAAAVGGLVGTISAGGPTLVVAGMDLLNTLNAAPGTSVWAK